MTIVGVLGAGQLGRMLALAGIPLGMRFRFLDPAPSPPAAALGEHLRADWSHPGALEALAEHSDVVTYESENIPIESVRRLASRANVRPSAESLRLTADRLAEKQFVAGLGIEVAPFSEVSDRAGLDTALRRLGVPALLKTRRGGYDGRGQARIDHLSQADAAWQALAGAPAILEQRVVFQRELAILAVRGLDGEKRVYPLVETHHEGGVLTRALAPSPDLSPSLQREAEAIASSLLEALGHVGILAIECFEINGRLVVNELAPRVHNSGHWTIEGAATSQFENHLRAITGLPLGSTEPRALCGLFNLLGEIPPLAGVLAQRETYLHVYGKTSRPGRKVGHVTVVASDRAMLDERMRHVSTLISPQVHPIERNPV